MIKINIDMRTKVLTVLLGVFIFGTSITNAQDPSVKDEPKYGATPEDSLKCIENLSVYGEYYKQKLYKEAYIPWKYVMLNCPKASKNTFIRGEKLVEDKLNDIKDKEAKAKLVDTLMLVHDRRIKYWGEEGEVLGRKGIDVLTYQGDYEKALAIFDKSIEIDGNNAHYNTLYYCMLSVVKLVQKEKLEKVKVIDYYLKLSAIAEWNVKNNESEKGKKKYADMANNIEGMAAPFMPCDVLVEIFTPKFEETPEDLELLKKIANLLEKKNCDDKDLYFNVIGAIIKLDPSAETALLAGSMSIKKEKWNDAVKYNEQAIELFTKLKDENPDADYSEELSKAYFSLLTAYKAKNSYLKARSYGYKHLEIKPDNGWVYIQIGLMYGASSSNCGDNPVTKKAGYWAGVDKFIKAKSVTDDEAVIEKANSLIYQFSAQFPNEEDLFFYSLKPGDSHKVGCWINETTTVRKR